MPPSKLPEVKESKENSKEESLDTNPPENEDGTQTRHTDAVEDKQKTTFTRLGPVATQNPDNSRSDADPNDLVRDREFRDDINKRMEMTADDLPLMTGADLDKQYGTTFANATKDGTRLIGSAIGGAAIGLNNKDIVDPTADNRSRVDDVGPRPPLHKYDGNSVDGPLDRDFFKGSRPETS